MLNIVFQKVNQRGKIETYTYEAIRVYNELNQEQLEVAQATFSHSHLIDIKDCLFMGNGRYLPLEILSEDKDGNGTGRWLSKSLDDTVSFKIERF